MPTSIHLFSPSCAACRDEEEKEGSLGVGVEEASYTAEQSFGNAKGETLAKAEHQGKAHLS